ncbi:MAG: HD domain-containing protein, partial [Bacteroidales bacterium]|nr:HD domain-containing protein [Bacteroidales bacterium]
MKPALEIWIDRAEETWLDALYDHAKALFQKSPLPSHDHTHHMRVWNLSKSLLREIATFNSRIDQSLVEGVLIATFFHDLGMATSTREDHGRLGSECCMSWFRDRGRTKPERFEEITRAIELHDRKDLQMYKSFSPDTAPEILGILSVADDLEALGIIGIFRYTEIYLERNIPLEELGTRILANVLTRFEHLSDGCRLCDRMLEKYRQQYDELWLFFQEYNIQLKAVSQVDAVSSGPLGVINYIRKHGLDKIALD